jgi:PIN domain nuclease of toxin-antitoxin system
VSGSISYVVDTSALLALVFEEEGCREVVSRLERSAVSVVNLAEAVTVLIRRGVPPAEARWRLEAIPFERVALSEREALLAGELDAITRPYGLSLGDRCCLATAKSLRATALTADRAWTRVKGAGVAVKAIR